MTSRRWLGLGALIVVGLGLLFARTTGGWLLDGAIWATHTNVPTLSTDGLAGALEGAWAPLLVDVRKEPEFAVSHLLAARRVDPSAGPEALGDVPKDQAIVTYCSVGARSAEFATRLVAAGFTDVHNLRGSLFRWAREGRPMVTGVGASARPTTQVHPYDDFWGLLIDDDRHALTP